VAALFKLTLFIRDSPLFLWFAGLPVFRMLEAIKQKGRNPPAITVQGIN